MEHRGVGVGGAGGGALGPQPLAQAAVGLHGLGELGRARAHAQLVGVAGVDPAEQRCDQHLEDLVAAAAPHQGADGVVATVVPRLGVEVVLLARPDKAFVGQDPRRGHRVEVGGHAEHQPLGEAPQLAAGPQVGRAGGRGGEAVVEAEPVAQLDGGRHPGEEGVGSLVEAVAGEGRGEELAAGALARLDEGHLHARLLGQVERRGQAGDATAQDDHRAGGPRPAAGGRAGSVLGAGRRSGGRRGGRGRGRRSVVVGARGAVDEVGQGRHHRRVVVDDVGAGERQADVSGHAGGFDVEVVDDLEVVGDEAVRAHQDAVAAAGVGEGADHLEDVGPAPRLGGPTGALPPDRPVGPRVETHLGGHRGGAVAELVGVRIAGQHALRQRVGGEQHLVALG